MIGLVLGMIDGGGPSSLPSPFRRGQPTDTAMKRFLSLLRPLLILTIFAAAILLLYRQLHQYQFRQLVESLRGSARDVSSWRSS